jgi:hypothetical protein
LSSDERLDAANDFKLGTAEVVVNCPEISGVKMLGIVALDTLDFDLEDAVI